MLIGPSVKFPDGEDFVDFFGLTGHGIRGFFFKNFFEHRLSETLKVVFLDLVEEFRLVWVDVGIDEVNIVE